MYAILGEVDYDIDNTVFSFIPNTAEVAYYGLMEGLNDYLNDLKLSKIFALGQNVTREQLRSIISHTVRTEKLSLIHI